MSNAAKRTCLLVLGMHRSGTSALTRVLSLMGAELPKDLMGPGRGNELGHWEPAQLVALHDQMLGEAGSSWNDWRKLDLAAQLPKERLEFYRAEIRRLIQDAYDDAPLFIIKDPRICRFVPLYRDLLVEMGIRVAPVLVYRNPLEVMGSLESRDETMAAHSQLYWLRHVLDAEQAIRHLPRAVLSYDALLANWRATIEHVRSTLQLTWPRTVADSAAEIEEFISSSHRHHVAADDHLGPKSDVALWVRETFQALTQLAADPVAAAARIDRIREPFDLASQLFSESFVAERTKHLALADAEKTRAVVEKARADTERERADAEKARADTETARADAEKDRAGTEIGRLKIESDDLRMNLANEKVAKLESERRSEEAAAAVRDRFQRLHELAFSANDKLEAERKHLLRELEKLEERKNVELRHKSWLIEQRDAELAQVQRSWSLRVGKQITAPVRMLRVASGNLRSVVETGRLVTRTVQQLANDKKSRSSVTWSRVNSIAKLALREPSTFLSKCRQYTTPSGLPLAQASSAPTLNSRTFEPLASDVRVSVIIVNYNGCHHLADVLDTLADQTHPDVEVIIVDNASKDGSLEFIGSHYPDVHLVALDKNTGFAEANNIGAEAASGDLIFLLNNDTRVEPDTISKLVDCLRRNPTVAAAGPKIRFWQPFVAVDVTVPDGMQLQVDTRFLNSSLTYKKLFFEGGWSSPSDSDDVRTLSGSARIWVPADDGVSRLTLKIRSNAGSQFDAHFRCGGRSLQMELNGDHWLEPVLEFGGDATCWLINNAGSAVFDSGEVRDRGFANKDDGTWDDDCVVTALCGCAFLFRREALDDDEPVFSQHYFAYFEDTDLSLRLRAKGYNLWYCHDSVVYHKHASTSGENSPIFRFYVNRNRLFFFTTHFPADFAALQLHEQRLALNHFRFYCKENRVSPSEYQFANRIEELFRDWDELIPKIHDGTFYLRDRLLPRIAVYNKFWNSLGGGEYHAAVLAECLQRFGPVDLISESDFDIERLANQFGLKLGRCRKVILTPTELHHKRRNTAKYDLFINSTFASDLVSHAKNSVYVVSFPQDFSASPPQVQAFLATYKYFLSNSEYTRTWCKRYWNVNAHVLYPSVPISTRPSYGEKSPLLLNVGRYFRHGHNKKQLELVEAFKTLWDAGRIGSDWRLVLAGQVEKVHEDYYEEVQQAALGYPIDVLRDLPRSKIDDLFARAAIYWHATGLNEDLDTHPDRAEHFGITTIEAMSQGCIPIVINAGGQPEIVHDGMGCLFNDVDELAGHTERLAKLFADDPQAFRHMSDAAYRRAGDYSKTATQERLIGLVGPSLQQKAKATASIEREPA